MARLPKHVTYYSYKNGRPFTDFLDPISDVTWKETTCGPNYLPIAANQFTPQTAAHSTQTNKGMSPGVRGENPCMVSSMQIAEQGKRTDPVSEPSKQKRKKSKKQKKRFQKLLALGVLLEEAETLCTIPWDVLEKMPYIKELLEIKNTMEQAPLNNAPVLSNNFADKLLSSIDCPSLLDIFRVGIQNSVPMNENQMKMVHRHLIKAITEQWTDGGGPEFIGFSFKSGWILVTCANQRSKDWLVGEVPYLEPWPGAQISVIPEKELPKPPRGITFIPKTEAASVQEALDLIKAQNKGLNTELWKLLSEKEEEAGKAITLYLDEPSAETLKAQECKAALGFTMVTFKFKGINRPYTSYTPTVTENLVSATPNQGNKPGHSFKCQGSQNYSDKPVQGRRTTMSQDGSRPTSSVAESFSVAHAVEDSRESHPSAGRNLAGFTQSIKASGIATCLVKPSSLAAKGHVIDMGVLAAQPITQKAQSFSKPGVAQNRSQGGIVIEMDGSTTLARGLAPDAVREKDGAWRIPHSQSKKMLQEGSRQTDGTLFHQGRRVGVTDRDKYSYQASTGRVTHHKDGSSDGGGTAYAGDKCVTVSTPQFRGGFGGPPIIQNSISGMALLQSKNAEADVRHPSQKGILDSTSIGRLNQSSDLSTYDVTLDKNRMSGVDEVFETKSGFGGRPIIRASQLCNTFGQDKVSRQSPVFDRDSALPTNHASQMSQPNFHAKGSTNSFGQDRNEADLTLVDMEESSEDGQSAEEEGGYSSWIIEEPQCYGTRLMQGGAVSTGTLHSANGLLHSAMVLGFGDPPIYNGIQFLQNYRDGSESHRETAILGRGLLPHPKNYYPVQGHESHGGPGQDGKKTEDRDFRTNGELLPHSKNSHGTQIQGPEGHGGQVQDDTETDRDFRSNRGLLPHRIYNCGTRIDGSVTVGGPVHDSRETEGNRDFRSNNRLWDHPRESHDAQIQDCKIRERAFHDREAVNDRDSSSDTGLLPHPKGGQFLEVDTQKSFQGTRLSETGWKSSSDRRPSLRARGGYDARTRDLSHERPRSRSPQEKRAWVKKPDNHVSSSQSRRDRELRPGRRISPRRRSGSRGRPVHDSRGGWDNSYRARQRARGGHDRTSEMESKRPVRERIHGVKAP